MSDSSLIKADPDEDKKKIMPPAMPMEDDDMFEDAGDLEFYDAAAPGNSFEKLYLARLPKYVWDSWAKLVERLGDNDEIQIGTLRTWNEPQPEATAEGGGGGGGGGTNGGGDVTKLRMLLNSNCPEHQSLPREYDLEILDRDVKNHFIFSEQDLPSYKAKNKARAEAAAAGIPQSLLRQRQNQGAERTQRPFDRRNRFQPFYRKAVPKRTKIFGKIHYDMRVEPRNLREEEALLAQRIFDAEHSKTKLQIISRNSASSIINPGTAGSVTWGGNFIKNAPPTVKPKKGEVFKAARIPKNQVLDLIFDCFRQYQYWSMKALRQKLQQPDSYLRQVLEEVAVLHKSGRFANHYGLNDAYKDKAGSEAKAEAADDGGDDEDEGDDADGDDDDENEEMEDVL